MNEDFEELESDFKKNSKDEEKNETVEDLINNIETLVKENENLIKEAKERQKKIEEKNEIKQEDISKMVNTLSDEQYETLLLQIKNWATETAFRISHGSPIIQMKTTTLAELFSSIYIAGMRGD